MSNVLQEERVGAASDSAGYMTISDRIKELPLKYVKVVTVGSVYEVNQGKHTIGVAFSFESSGNRKKRTTVSGNTEDELFQKARSYLIKRDNKESSGSNDSNNSCPLSVNRKNNCKTFREVGEQWMEEYSKKLDADRRQDASEMRYASEMQHSGRKPYAKGKNITYHTLKTMSDNYAIVIKAVGDIPIQEFTQEAAQASIDKFIYKKDGGVYSRAYVSKLVWIMENVVYYAYQKGMCSHTLRKIQLSNILTTVKADERFLDREQIAEIKDAVSDNPRFKVLVDLLTQTGLRQEEALALTVDDFRELRNGIVEVAINKTVVLSGKNTYEVAYRTKTRRGTREVYIPDSLYEEIKEYYDDCIRNESDKGMRLRQENNTMRMIFVDRYRKPINKHNIEADFRKHIRKYGNGKIKYQATLHMFRHSYASFMAEKLDFEKVAKLLGDNPNTVYNKYYSVSKDDKKNIVEYISSLNDSIDGHRQKR